MKRPCLGRCGRLIERGSYCSRCAKQRQLERRGTTAKQRSFRRAALATTGGECALCGNRDGVQAHHREPLSEGGRDDAQANGTPLCKLHHQLAHRS